MKNKKLVIFSVVLLIFIAGSFGYYYVTQMSENSNQPHEVEDQNENQGGSVNDNSDVNNRDSADDDNHESNENDKDADDQDLHNGNDAKTNDSPSDVDRGSDGDGKTANDSKCSDYLGLQGTFDADEKAQICENVVEPAIMYYGNLSNEDLISISIEHYTQSEDYLYIGTERTTLTNGNARGWLFGYQGGGVTDIWWHPPCETGAPTPEFSDQFRQKYPDIVEFCGQ